MKLSIFGATGSIGQQVFDILRQRSHKDYEIEVITARENIGALADLALEFDAKHVVIEDETKRSELCQRLPNISIGAGKNALCEAATHDVDWLCNAIVGAAGLPITMAAIGHCQNLALANKESLVAGGGLVNKAIINSKTNLIPVDSEHSALFQSLLGQDKSAVSKLILTASGGPFRGYSKTDLAKVTLSEALEHPNWSMGQRITIDSASMFNKALEMIEAKELFHVSSSQIDVLVHPQSIIHSLVSFQDGAQIAQLGLPDMRQAIGFSLDFPHRKACGVEALDLAKIARLDFELPDENTFPAIRLAREAMETGGMMGAVLNASKEAALDAFLDGQIPFIKMAAYVEDAMKNFISEARTAARTLEDVLAIDMAARLYTKTSIKKAGFA